MFVSVRLVCPAVLLLVVACSDTASVPVVTGTYTLAKVNGVTLPAPFPSSSGQPTTATGGSLLLSDDHSWSAEVALQAGTPPVPFTLVRNGTWTMGKDTVYLKDLSDNSVSPAILNGATLSASQDGQSFEFKRQ